MRIKQQYKLRTIAGEEVIFIQGKVGVDTNKVLSFNESAIWLWEEIHSKDFSEEEVAEILFEHFDIEREQALQDAKEFISTLQKFNIIEE